VPAYCPDTSTVLSNTNCGYEKLKLITLVILFFKGDTLTSIIKCYIHINSLNPTEYVIPSLDGNRCSFQNMDDGQRPDTVSCYDQNQNKKTVCVSSLLFNAPVKWLSIPIFRSRIWGYRSRGYEEFYLLEYNTM
jgi:hypothetical protein